MEQFQPLITNHPTHREQEKFTAGGESDCSLKFPLVKASTGTTLRGALLIFSSIKLQPRKKNVTFWAGRLRGRSSSPGRGKIILLSTASRPVLGLTHPPIQWVLGALSPEVKRPGSDADHSHSTNAEVKNTWI
jgi:hypothetical protein